jgi:hypothetical protein
VTVAHVSSGGPRSTPPAKTAPAAPKPAKSFADLLGQLGQPETPGDDMTLSVPLPEPKVDLLQFNVAASVSANAIRFDARPILGETNLTFSEAEVPASEVSGAMSNGPEPAAALPDNPIGIESVRWMLSSLAQQLVSQAVQSAVQPAQPGPPLTAASPSHSAAPTVASQRRAAGVVASERTAAPPSPQLAQAAQSKALFAKLAMHPLEIRLVIHGAQLSAADLAALTDELTGLLAGTRFADRPIRVLAATRRN